MSPVIQRRTPAPSRVLNTFASAQNEDRGDCGEFGDGRGPMKNVGGVAASADGEGRRNSGVKHQHAHPAVEKGDAGAEGFLQVDVGTAGAGKAACQLSVAQSAGQGHRSHQKPHGKKPEGRAERFGHPRGREKNSDADNFADDGGGGRAQAQLTPQFRGWDRDGQDRCCLHTHGQKAKRKAN